MKIPKKKSMALLLILSMLVLLVVKIPLSSNAAEVKVNLRSTASFAILAGETITNTGSSVINGDAGGDVGVYPGSAFTGDTKVTIAGAVHLSDAIAEQAKQDLVLAYDDAAGRIPTTTFTETDNQLGGKTLTTGVYAFGHATTANLTASSPLILDAQGDPEAVFIFQASSDLVTASGSQIVLVNGAKFCRIFWQVTSSATLGTGSHFVGHIFALTSIQAQTGATIQGQLLARNGSVTLDNNTITNGLCTTVGENETASVTAGTTAATTAGTTAATTAGTTAATTAATTAPTTAATTAATTAPTTAATTAVTTPAITATTTASTSTETTAETETEVVKEGTSPQTGDYSADYSDMGMTAAASGIFLAINGVILYLRRKNS
ncbi:ice-binding family protein [[Clostridium] fimetarium]|uniref:DUF3494 domain-containing protein n=1 Tax=[Clostridium] fimetarium TaxID=99656 RepID=A0A1I0MZK1_9FIRM|nr:ice-binding family protein [[Clostridium] fimetarium]SEV93919.1 Protein of unknown function [[Clostridium] fimetarium]